MPDPDVHLDAAPRAPASSSATIMSAARFRQQPSRPASTAEHHTIVSPPRRPSRPAAPRADTFGNAPSLQQRVSPGNAQAIQQRRPKAGDASTSTADPTSAACRWADGSAVATHHSRASRCRCATPCRSLTFGRAIQHLLGLLPPAQALRHIANNKDQRAGPPITIDASSSELCTTFPQDRRSAHVVTCAQGRRHHGGRHFLRPSHHTPATAASSSSAFAVVAPRRRPQPLPPPSSMKQRVLERWHDLPQALWPVALVLVSAALGRASPC